jgi:hypothetical protein
VGIVTERDFMQVAGQLLEQHLHGPATGERERVARDFAHEGTDD